MACGDAGMRTRGHGWVRLGTVLADQGGQQQLLLPSPFPHDARHGGHLLRRVPCVEALQADAQCAVGGVLFGALWRVDARKSWRRGRRGPAVPRAAPGAGGGVQRLLGICPQPAQEVRPGTPRVLRQCRRWQVAASKALGLVAVPHQFGVVRVRRGCEHFDRARRRMLGLGRRCRTPSPQHALVPKQGLQLHRPPSEPCGEVRNFPPPLRAVE
mmetsp:Transcript_3471/g.10776  ORF Transcript_3471/g.10776 Transcript_3471/m.10776 type:complete len:213 (-) Transcript_3471:563-1201(-)